MNVLALRPLPAAGRPLPAADRRIARVEVLEDMGHAKSYWRALEQGDSLCAPYQRYELLKLWQRHAGTAAGMTPFIVVGFNAQGAPLFLWPLGRRRFGGLQVAEFLGGKHANFNMAVWRRNVAENIEPDELRGLEPRGHRGHPRRRSAGLLRHPLVPGNVSGLAVSRRQLDCAARGPRPWLARIQAILGDAELRGEIVSELQRLSPAYGFEAMAAKYLALID